MPSFGARRAIAGESNHMPLTVDGVRLRASAADSKAHVEVGTTRVCLRLRLMRAKLEPLDRHLCNGSYSGWGEP
jgi:hypothetical protein